MRILVMGGTRFIGRHFVSVALEHGHEVTLFHRRPVEDALFSPITQIAGDRDRPDDLAALACTGTWDATIDFCAYVPRHVRTLHSVLGNRSGLYVLISSTEVYAPHMVYGFNEDSQLSTLADPTTETVTNETYGGLKVLCEHAAHAYNRNLIVRPTYVVGTHDYTGRFNHWVNRLDAGGRILAPGPREAMFQLIDVRDLTTWMMRLVELEVTGIYHAAHPFPPVAFGELLDEICAVASVGGGGRVRRDLHWVDRDFLLAAGCIGADLPLWPGASLPDVLEAADPARALSTGLAPRPLAETICDTYRHELHTRPDIPASRFLSRAREAELLAQWSHAA